MPDIMLPMECLAECQCELEALKNDTAFLPRWITKDQAIQTTENQIKVLEAHIQQFGNTWETEYADPDFFSCTKE